MKGEWGRRLLKGFFGKDGLGIMGSPETFMEQEDSGRSLPLDVMVRELLALKKEAWIAYAWSRELLAGKFSWEQRLEYGRMAAECGRKEAELLLGKLDNPMKVDAAFLSNLALAMDVTLDTPQTPNGGGHVIFAQYEEPDKITIFMDSVEKASLLIKDYGLEEMLEQADAKALLLAHELFHVTEYKKRSSIYTQTERVELWRKPFSNRSPIICLGEIAGMEFAGCMLGISYSPYVFDVIT